jgi:Tol biopolymer transport system component
MKADGTDVTKLPHDALQAYGPVWSPGGSSIVFVSDSSRIYVMRTDGSNLRRIGPEKRRVAKMVSRRTIAFVAVDDQRTRARCHHDDGIAVMGRRGPTFADGRVRSWGSW